jgi:hypothetical protein
MIKSASALVKVVVRGRIELPTFRFSGLADTQLSPAKLQCPAVCGCASLALAAHVAVTVAVKRRWGTRWLRPVSAPPQSGRRGHCRTWLCRLSLQDLFRYPRWTAWLVHGQAQLASGDEHPGAGGCFIVLSRLHESSLAARASLQPWGKPRFDPDDNPSRTRIISLGSLSYDPRPTCGHASLRHFGSSDRE